LWKAESLIRVSLDHRKDTDLTGVESGVARMPNCEGGTVPL